MTSRPATGTPITPAELRVIRAVIDAARAYAAFTHGNLGGEAYRRREEARDRLLDALSRLDVTQRKAA